MALFTFDVPEWEAAQIPDGRVVIEKEIKLRLSPVIRPDGSVFEDTDLGMAGFFTYREPAVGVTEIWNEETQSWEADPGTDVSDFQSISLIFQADDPFPWWTTVMALGQKAADGTDKFQQAVGAPGVEYPLYFFRCYFGMEMEDDTMLTGLSPATAPIRFIEIGETVLAGLRMDKSPDEASQMQLFLRDTNRRLIGMVELRRLGNASRLSLVKLDNMENPVSRMTIAEDGHIEVVAHEREASLRTEIQLAATGDIEISAAPGKAVVINDNLRITDNSIELVSPGDLTLKASKVIIESDLEAERVRYLPNGGGPKQWLV